MQTFIKNLAPLADSIEVAIYEKSRNERPTVTVKVWKNPDGSITVETEEITDRGMHSVEVDIKTHILGKEGYKSQIARPQEAGRTIDVWRESNPTTRAIFQRLFRSIHEGQNEGATHAQATLLNEAEYAYVGGNYAECLTCLDKYDASKESPNV